MNALDIERFEAVGIVLRPVPSLSLPVDCAAWASKLRTMLAADLSGERANTLHRSPVDVRRVGFPVEGILQESNGLIREHFGMSSGDLEVHACFAVLYSPEANQILKLHRDDSDVTLNICLERSDDLEGTEVVFHGTEGLKHPKLNHTPTFMPYDKAKTLVNVPKGWVAIHRGCHAHETTPLRQGHRLSVICWFKYVLDSQMAIARYAHYYNRLVEDVTLEEVEASAARAKGWAEATLCDFNGSHTPPRLGTMLQLEWGMLVLHHQLP